MPDEPTPTATTGAMPATGATPAGAAAAGQTPPTTSATPAASTTQQPASTTDDTALGESGKAILREARAAAKAAEDRAKAAETERDALKTATQSDAEKAQSAAVKEAEKRVAGEFESRIRRSEVRRALTAAGIAEGELDLASLAPEFAKLKVSDSGDLDGITEVITAFKTAHPGLFGKAGDGIANLGGGVRQGSGSTLTIDEVKRMTPDQINARWPEVQQLLASSR